MALFFGAALLIIGLVSAVVVALGVPLFFGILAYDMVATPRTQTKSVQDASMRIAVERGVARAFVIAGGVFWSIAAFAGLYSFRTTGMAAALLAAFYPLVAILATLIVGWYFERFTAAMLVVASAAVVTWGVVYGFELGVWILVSLALIVPMLTAATLFWLARRDQEEFERVVAAKPELAPIFAARSTIGRI